LSGCAPCAVPQHAHEFGLRLALGARPRDILRLVIAQSARLAAIGGLIGVAAAWLITRVLQSLLFHVPARDALSFTASGVLLGAVAMLASYLPARRAARVDPIRT